MISESLKDIVLNKVTEKKKRKKRKVKKSPESRFDRTTKVHTDITDFLGHTDPDPSLVVSDVVAEDKTEVVEKKKYTNMKPRSDMETMTIPTDFDKDEEYKDHKVFTKDPRTEEDDEIWYGQGADGEMEEPEPNEVIYRESEEDEELVDVDSLTSEQYIEYMLRQEAPEEYLEYVGGQDDPDNVDYLDAEEEARILKLSGGNIDAEEIAKQQIKDKAEELIKQQQLEQPVVKVEPESIDSYMDIPEVDIDIDSVMSKMQSLSFEETPEEFYDEPESVQQNSFTPTPDIAEPLNNVPGNNNFVDDIKKTLTTKSPDEISNSEFSDIESIPTVEVDMVGAAEDLMAKISAISAE